MPAWCPVCQREIKTLGDLCPHVAAVELACPNRVVTVQDGKPVHVLPVRGAHLEVLSDMGTVGNARLWFSPNPKVYNMAVEVWMEYGEPVDQAYRLAWRQLGMEHEQWA